MQTFYFLYKTTNLINNKIYIGKHKTKNLDDGYIGSGKLLKHAILKYGLDNFKFEIIEFFENEQLLNEAEKQIVTEEFCLQKDNYNLCVGGKGGFSYINREGLSPERKRFSDPKKQQSACNAASEKLKILMESDEFRKKRSIQATINNIKRFKYSDGTFKGKQHSEETKKKISESKKVTSKGENNSQFGTMWITNGIENKKIKTVDLMPEGYYKGRKII